MKRLTLSALMAVFLGGCGTAVSLKPVTFNSDPREETRQKMRDANEADSVEAFVAAHPELDAQTKKDLRDGTISRHAALEKIKKKLN